MMFKCCSHEKCEDISIFRGLCKKHNEELEEVWKEEIRADERKNLLDELMKLGRDASDLSIKQDASFTTIYYGMMAEWIAKKREEAKQ